MGDQNGRGSLTHLDAYRSKVDMIETSVRHENNKKRATAVALAQQFVPMLISPVLCETCRMMYFKTIDSGFVCGKCKADTRVRLDMWALYDSPDGHIGYWVAKRLKYQGKELLPTGDIVVSKIRSMVEYQVSCGRSWIPMERDSPDLEGVYM